MLTGPALFSGFYLNELLMKLLARHDPHATLFDAYAATVARLAEGDEAGTQAALRAFEIVLLKEIGLLPDLATETASRRPVGAAQRYRRAFADAGVVEAESAAEARRRAGRRLLALQAALAGRRTSARCSGPRAARWPSCGRCCARSFTIISALRSCARAR